MHSMIRPAIVLFLILTVITGIVYPLVVTGIGQVVFPTQANGSVILEDGKPVGSSLIGQSFVDPKYFWSRPSATTPQPYNGEASGASNLGPLNPALTDAIQARVKAVHETQGDSANPAPVPIDLVTASGSGLDPDISLAAAYYQAPRIARLRGLEPAAVRALIDAHAQGRWLGLIGEPRVNVLELNLALDQLCAAGHRCSAPVSDRSGPAVGQHAG